MLTICKNTVATSKQIIKFHLRIMAEKKTTKKVAAAPKETEAKKTTTKKVTTKKETVVLNAENVGFKAGDVYQALAAAGQALSAKEIAKAAGISEAETYLGMGWLFKEGKIVAADDKVALA